MISRRRVLISGGVVGAVFLAGCLSDSEPGYFDFERVIFSDENPGDHDSYDDVPEQRTYTIEDTVWLLVVVRNAPTDDDGTASLEYTFRTETPDETTWEPVVERDEQWDDVEETDLLVVWESFPTYPEDPPGEYEMRIAVEDQVEGERLRTDETFRLEREGE